MLIYLLSYLALKFEDNSSVIERDDVAHLIEPLKAACDPIMRLHEIAEKGSIDSEILRQSMLALPALPPDCQAMIFQDMLASLETKGLLDQACDLMDEDAEVKPVMKQILKLGGC